MEPQTSRYNRYIPIVVFFFLCVLAVQAVSSLSIKSPSIDEPNHLVFGFAALTQQEYRYGADHPPFIRSLAALPLLFMDLRLPENYFEGYYEMNGQAQFALGPHFIFQTQNDVGQIMLLSRLPIIFLAMLLGIYVFLWAQKLYGNKAGILALIFYVFSPNILAHARLVTTDFGATCFIFIACFYYWTYLNNPTFRTLCLGSLFTGLALVSKYSAVILLPALLLYVVVWLFNNYRSSGRFLPGSTEEGQALWSVKRLLLHVPVAVLIVLGIIFIAFGMNSNPIASYMNGLQRLQDMLFADKPPHLYYLWGMFFTEPAWFFPIVAFLVKTPAPTLILLAGSAVIGRRTGSSLFSSACLIIPVALITVSCFFDSEHTGLRRLLPIYPFLFVFISRVVIPITDLNISALRKKVTSGVLAILVAGYLVFSVKVYPDYLTYFNEFVGGPMNGINYLDDSNIDWGQDLGRLKTFMDETGIKEVKLLYKGWADPRYYKISAREMSPEDRALGPQPGYFAISAHYLIRLKTIPEAFGFSPVWKEKVLEPIAVIGNTIYIFKFDAS